MYRGGPLDGREGLVWDQAESMDTPDEHTYRRTELRVPHSEQNRALLVYELVEPDAQ